MHGRLHQGRRSGERGRCAAVRGITINSAAITVFWHVAQTNVIDTPGHTDFNIVVNRSRSVPGGAVVVVVVFVGVKPQTDTN